MEKQSWMSFTEFGNIQKKRGRLDSREGVMPVNESTQASRGVSSLYQCVKFRDSGSFFLQKMFPIELSDKKIDSWIDSSYKPMHGIDDF